MNKQKKLFIKKSDLVKVIAGGQKGLIGQILFIDYQKNRAILEGAKCYTKRLKNNKEQPENQNNKDKKEILIPISIHVSNLMHWDEKKQKAIRIRSLYSSSKANEVAFKKFEKELPLTIKENIEEKIENE